jgi:hypothetical protein
VLGGNDHSNPPSSNQSFELTTGSDVECKSSSAAAVVVAEATEEDTSAETKIHIEEVQ